MSREDRVTPKPIEGAKEELAPSWRRADPRKTVTHSWKSTPMVINTVDTASRWHHPDITASYGWVEVR
jgi:4a-hydroxytetrahydrobiopterin dehydratase